jgi:uracil-DNA glycosylase
LRPSDYVHCPDFPCRDVRHECYQIPEIDLAPESVRILLISEAVPANSQDDYYAGPDSLFAHSTLLAFQDAGFEASRIPDLLALGVYLTSSVKCAKTGYAIQKDTLRACSCLLEKEIALFPNVLVYLLMGDVAIQAINLISQRQGSGRVIPAGATYKLRGGEYTYQGRRLLPSYLQAGPSFFIEKSKRRMIAADIAAAFQIASRSQS